MFFIQNTKPRLLTCYDTIGVLLLGMIVIHAGVGIIDSVFESKRFRRPIEGIFLDRMWTSNRPGLAHGHDR